MPATEQTWRSSKLLHRIFGITSAALLLSTIWMFAKDHDRSWKPYQKTSSEIEIHTTNWREYQFQTDKAIQDHQQLEIELAQVRRRSMSAELLDQFRQAAEDVSAAPATAAELAEFSRLRTVYEAALREATSGESDDRTEQAGLAIEASRERLLNHMNKMLQKAKFQEVTKLGQRKFKSADLDAAKANVGLAVRDNAPQEKLDKLQAKVDSIKLELDDLSRAYEGLKDHRLALQATLDQLLADERRMHKLVADNRAELDRLQNTAHERRSTYFNFVYGIPLPGKKLLETPIFDAFNSPLKIDNLWSDGLTQDYNFARVRRFDRCTTCHRAIDRSLPGAANDPAFPAVELLNFALDVFDERQVTNSNNSDPNAAISVEKLIEETYGLRLAAEGLLSRTDVTISYVRIDSLAAKAELIAGPSTRLTAAQVRVNLMSAEEPTTEPNIIPGLLLGDVISEINGDPATDPQRVAWRLAGATAEARKQKQRNPDFRPEPLRLVIRRGLPNPYASHPRLDLFVGSLSPHKLSDFACTVCHDGQGSATDFKWASHTPNSERQRKDWRDEHGWFDNHHWIYPMYARRFAESACLKCHHDVVELEPSQRFPNPPAPTLMHGYDLVRKYGCYGCHEINGYDGTRRIGPDMRLEPNFFAAGLALAHDLPTRRSFIDQHAQRIQGRLAEVEAALSQMPEDHPSKPATKKQFEQLQSDAITILTRGVDLSTMIELATRVGRNQDDAEARLQLLELLDQDASRADADDQFGPTLTADQLRLRALLKEADSPGQMRKSGPSLRYVASKVDSKFLYDWIREPQHFRPTTRMPQFFGLWNHLDGKGRELAEHYEPLEILGLVTYLQLHSQPFEYLSAPQDISPSSVAEQIERGKTLFQVRGCLACHNHADFPDAASQRASSAIVQGPDLSGIGSKLDSETGRKWLYTWIKQPTRYHVRTVMPDLFLSPIEQRDDKGQVVANTDPAGDIAEYLLQSKIAGYVSKSSTSVNSADLDKLVMENLRETFHESKATEYLTKGIPESRRSALKFAETELIVRDGEFERSDFRLSEEQKLSYLGRKTIIKYGCYGCHDIPGFEDAKPIGTGLGDWGRKDPSRLAFEHIVQYLHHGSHSHEQAAVGAGHANHAAIPREIPSDFYMQQIHSGNRIGFIYQKLNEPRSYDYHTVENKRYNERLRMPQFPFDAGEREAVIAFVLGLVADPPAEKFVYRPDPRHQALNDGRVVLEKYNCGGCHILAAERWEISYPAELFPKQVRKPSFPFVETAFSSEPIQASMTADRRGLLRGTLIGMPTLNDSGIPMLIDEFGDDVDELDQYDPLTLDYPFQLWQPAILAGHDYQVGESPINIPGRTITRRHPSDGGYLAKYLLPHVVRIEKAVNPNAKGSQAWGWVPPPLVGQGTKTQSEWLHNFLIDPHPIRPAVFLRMPKFNLSPDEATKLVNYFAARDDAQYPYEFAERRRTSHLEQAEADYQNLLQSIAGNDGAVSGTRFDHAMNIVTNKNYCITCHIVGDFNPTSSDRAKAPNLADTYKRLRTDYVRKWIAKPTSVLPYTGMPVNIAYDPTNVNLGGVSQDLFHGTSIEQLDGLVDLLMNFDAYTRSRSLIAPLVAAAAAEEASEAPKPDGEQTSANAGQSAPSPGGTSAPDSDQ